MLSPLSVPYTVLETVLNKFKILNLKFKIMNNMFFRLNRCKTKPKLVSGLTIVELLVSLAILLIVVVIISGAFIDFRKNQALIMDTDTIVGTLRQARNQTLSSKDSSLYGVHFSSQEITLFVGGIYDEEDPDNQEFVLSSTDLTLNTNLFGGGDDVIFNRLTGETSQYGTITVTSSGLSKSKIVTIYKTGLIELQ